MSMYFLLMGELGYYDEDILDTPRHKLVKDMEDEMKSLHKNGIYELVELPKSKKVRTRKWIFRLKQKKYTSAPRYKEKLLVKGFCERKMVNFDDIFSPVMNFFKICMMLGLTTSLNLEAEQMDVKTIFLHNDLDKEIYINQPKAFVVIGKNYVYKLRKGLYVLKKDPRECYLKVFICH